MKLADFGLARIYDARDQSSLSHQVATRQYRAPELLFASRHYTPSVDVWSAAVVMAELVSLQVSEACYTYLYNFPCIEHVAFLVRYHFVEC